MSLDDMSQLIIRRFEVLRDLDFSSGNICGQFQLQAGCSTLGTVHNNGGSWFQFKAGHATSGCFDLLVRI
jgi:hypothetical protein